MTPDELTFVSDPGYWPHWPTCPVVNRSTGRLGFLWDGAGATVYMDNIWNLKPGTLEKTTANLELAAYPSLEALLADWRID